MVGNRKNPEAIKGGAIITPPEDCEADCEGEFERDYEEGREEGHEEDHGEDYWTNGQKREGGDQIEIWRMLQSDF